METSTGPEAEPDARPAPTPTIDEAHHGPSRRPSISKRPSIRDMDDDGTGVPSAFERLPDEIIQQ